jgi:hypothetical protein
MVTNYCSRSYANEHHFHDTSPGYYYKSTERLVRQVRASSNPCSCGRGAACDRPLAGMNNPIEPIIWKLEGQGL